jgi:hypothetical protein
MAGSWQLLQRGLPWLYWFLKNGRFPHSQPKRGRYGCHGKFL